MTEIRVKFNVQGRYFILHPLPLGHSSLASYIEYKISLHQEISDNLPMSGYGFFWNCTMIPDSNLFLTWEQKQNSNGECSIFDVILHDVVYLV